MWCAGAGRVIGVLGLAIAFLVAGARPSEAVPIADSVAEFSPVQGRDGWFYGYYADPSDPGTFTLMDYFDPSGAGGRGWWEKTPTQPPWVLLWDEGGHPGGTEWAVRRWVSDVAGWVEVSGNIYRRGSGFATVDVLAHILVDGSEVYREHLVVPLGQPAADVDYSVVIPVEVGTAVDFAIDPGSSNSGDSTRFTALISRTTPPIPEPSTGGLLLLGLALLTRGGGRRSRWSS